MVREFIVYMDGDSNMLVPRDHQAALGRAAIEVQSCGIVGVKGCDFCGYIVPPQQATRKNGNICKICFVNFRHLCRFFL